MAVHRTHVDAVQQKLHDELKRASEVVQDFGDVFVKALEDALRAGFLAKLDAVIAAAGVTPDDVQKAQTKLASAHSEFDADPSDSNAALVIEALVLAEAKAEALVVFNLLKTVADLFRESGKSARAAILDAIPDLLIIGLSEHDSKILTAGQERVFDFRTREVGTFTYGTAYSGAPIAHSVGTGVASAGVEAYVGLGWKRTDRNKSLKAAYSGLFATADVSAGVGVLAGVSAAGIYSVSAAWGEKHGLARGKRAARLSARPVLIRLALNHVSFLFA